MKKVLIFAVFASCFMSSNVFAASKKGRGPSRQQRMEEYLRTLDEAEVAADEKQREEQRAKNIQLRIEKARSAVEMAKRATSCDVEVNNKLDSIIANLGNANYQEAAKLFTEAVEQAFFFEVLNYKFDLLYGIIDRFSLSLKIKQQLLVIFARRYFHEDFLCHWAPSAEGRFDDSYFLRGKVCLALLEEISNGQKRVFVMDLEMLRLQVSLQRGLVLTTQDFNTVPFDEELRRKMTDEDSSVGKILLPEELLSYDGEEEAVLQKAEQEAARKVQEEEDRLLAERMQQEEDESAARMWKEAFPRQQKVAGREGRHQQRSYEQIMADLQNVELIYRQFGMSELRKLFDDCIAEMNRLVGETEAKKRQDPEYDCSYLIQRWEVLKRAYLLAKERLGAMWG
mgnify:CR=1 FL=1|jgi:hypothetical protein